MLERGKLKTGQTVLVISQSRATESPGHRESLAMVGRICVVNTDCNELGVSVLDPAMKSAWVFARSEIEPCPRLSNEALRAIKLIAKGNRAELVPGLRIAISGNPVCDLEVIEQLANLGLVARVPSFNAWVATEKGARLVVKSAA